MIRKTFTPLMLQSLKVLVKSEGRFCYSQHRFLSTQNSQTGSLPEFDFQEFVGQINAERIRWNIPAAAFAIVGNIDGRWQSFTASTGVKSIGSKEEIDADTRFCIGSTTKHITSLAVSTLVQEGLLDWNKPIKEYWPGFRMSDKFAEERATLIDLLSHRTGYYRFDELVAGRERSVSEYLELFSKTKPKFDFRSGYEYNNCMYAVVGELMNRVKPINSKRFGTWENIVQKNILEPLGIHGDIGIDAIRRSNNSASFVVAEPFWSCGTEVLVESNSWIDQILPAGGLFWSIKDYAKWLEFLLHHSNCKLDQINKHVSKTSFDMVFKPHSIMSTDPFSSLTYGLGMIFTTYQGKRMASHSGSVNGHYCSLYIFPDDQLAVAILTNGRPLNICEDVADRLLFKDSKDLKNLETEYQLISDENLVLEHTIQQLVLVSPTLPINRYCGKYKHPLLGTLAIRKSILGMELSLCDTFVPGLVITLLKWNENQFTVSLSASKAIPSPTGPFFTFKVIKGSVVEVNFMNWTYTKI
jgi:CubicO group peptidase (beta-lactamase class C family)